MPSLWSIVLDFVEYSWWDVLEKPWLEICFPGFLIISDSSSTYMINAHLRLLQVRYLECSTEYKDLQLVNGETKCEESGHYLFCWLFGTRYRSLKISSTFATNFVSDSPCCISIDCWCIYIAFPYSKIVEWMIEDPVQYRNRSSKSCLTQRLATMSKIALQTEILNFSLRVIPYHCKERKQGRKLTKARINQFDCSKNPKKSTIFSYLSYENFSK